MTGYRDEDSSYLGYDLECIEEPNSWNTYIYKDGERLQVIVSSKKKESLFKARSWIRNHAERNR